MNPILKNAQKEFEFFKNTEMQHSKETIFYHAHKIASYEYLIYLIEQHDWDEYNAREPDVYHILASNTSLLDFFYDTVISDGLLVFNTNLLDELLQLY